MMEGDTKAHAIYNKDPEEWMQFVYKQVTVLAEDGTEHTGWVFTVDPVSETIVLAQFDQDGNVSIDIINGSTVSKVTVINNNTEIYRVQLDQLFKPASVLALTPDEMKRRQLLLKSWLEKNRIPVTVDGDILTIADALFIEPPYGFENCRSTNEIVLGRIQGLIKNMPEDHDTW
ncbi:gem-associated protein 6-like [Haliotis cracherodii]|uniref:gem-associated protein 6-like n=1 Tax=Haliotis rufescens TaxID=6454 RepID=UPI001EAF98B1|nr:gem-associated protein 6-like [Haliotis rufescens]